MSNHQKFLRAGTLAMAGLLLALAGAMASAPGRGDAVPAAAQIPTGPFVALTFDDGPKAETTPYLLDELGKRGVHATFFVIGQNVAGNEDLLLRMEREGHQIGMHTFHHRSLADVNGTDFYAEVDQLRDTLSTLLGRENFMLRPPYGIINPSNRARAGSPIILWSVDPADWSDRDTARQLSVILDNAKDGDIILLHDIYSASVDTAVQAVDALIAQGYKFVTVEELFALRGITPENGAEYRRLPPSSGQSPLHGKRPSGIPHCAPLPLLSPRDPLRWAHAGPRIE